MGGVSELEDVLGIHYPRRDGCKSIVAPCYNVAEIFEDKQLNAQEGCNTYRQIYLSYWFFVIQEYRSLLST